MKLLQVNNLASMVGGTANCALSITKCFPDMQHHIHFIGFSNDEAEKAFAGHEVTCGQIKQSYLDAADIAIFHNTGEQNFPQHLPSNLLSVFYQHSAARSLVSCAKRCDFHLSVSKFLSNKVGAGQVVYQPVELVDGIEDSRQKPRIIRYCTPNTAKWPEGVEKLYEAIASEHRDTFRFLFVGCPESLKKRLFTACGDANFLPASPGAIQFLGASDILLYEGPEETYGRTICEAQRSGCLPIVSNHGGFSEQIENGKTGFLFSSHSEVGGILDDLKEMDSFEKFMVPLRQSGDTRGSRSSFRRNFLRTIKGEHAPH